MTEEEIFKALTDTFKDDTKKYNDWAMKEDKRRVALMAIGFGKEKNDNLEIKLTSMRAGDAVDMKYLLLSMMEADEKFAEAVLDVIPVYIIKKSESGKLV